MPDIVERYRIVGSNEVTAAFNQIVRQSQTTANRMAGFFRAAFAGVSVATIGHLLTSTIQAGDEIVRGAQKAGIGAKAYSELSFAARQAEIDQQAFATSLRMMQVNLSEASSGAKAQTAALRALGLTIDDIKSLDPDRQFELIAEQISRIKDPADRTRAAVKLFGDAGADLLPMFERGAEGIRLARQEAEKLGASLTEADLDKFKRAADALDAMSESWRQLKNAGALAIADDFAEVSDKIQVLLGHAPRFKELEVRIRDLKREAESPVPLYFNFGYIKGAPVVIGPDEIHRWIQILTEDQKRLSLAAKIEPVTLAGGGTPGAPPGFASVTQEQLDKLKPVVVTSTKIITDFSAMLRATATDTQRAAHEFQEFRIQLEQLLEAGLVDQAEFDKRMADYLDRNLQAVEVTAERIETVNDKTRAFLNTLSDEMVRQRFQIIRNLVFDLASGADNFGDHMIDAFKRILADAATAQFFEMLAGLKKTGEGKTGFLGFLGSAAGFLLSGALAEGGPVSGGRAYVVGERGPEIFVPKSAGTVVPNGRTGGAITYAPVTHYHIDSRSDRAAIRQDMIAISAEVSRMQLDRFRDYVSRGGR